jgi:hypothetical protein
MAVDALVGDIFVLQIPDEGADAENGIRLGRFFIGTTRSLLLKMKEIR